MKTVPIMRRGIVREHKLYKVYLSIDMNDLWEELHRRNIKFDVTVLIPETNNADKPDLLKLADKMVMRIRVITGEYRRFKIYLSSVYNDIWRYLNDNKIKVDIILMLG